MTASVLKKPGIYTAQDLERLSDQGHHYGLVQGELHEIAPPRGMHGSSMSHLTILVRDFAFIAKDRLPRLPATGYIPAKS